METLHSVLRRQLARLGLDPDRPPEDPGAWASLLDRISNTYGQADESRYLLERSLRISSDEMAELYSKLQEKERRIERERDRLRATMAAFGDGLCVFDAEGHCQSLNPEGQRMLGWQEADVIGQPLFEWINPSHPAQWRELASIRREESRLTRRDGSTLPACFTMTTLFEEGERTGHVLSFRDNTEILAAKAAVEREREQLLLLVNSSPIPIAMLDAEMRYMAHSRSWVELSGAPLQDLVGMSHLEVFGSAPTRWQSAFDRALNGETVSSPEDSVQSPDGQIMHLRWTVQPWQTTGGDKGGVMVVFDRIDGLVHAREMAIEAGRLKAEFLANMSHEIRTPLNGVIGMADLLTTTRLDENQQDYADTIVQSADGLLIIINDILDFSKIEAGHLDLESIEFAPRAVVHDVVSMLGSRAQEKGLEIVCLVHHDVPTHVKGDPGRLRQILLNLVGNAIKFTGSGEVTVVVRHDGTQDGKHQLLFEVEDTGIGIDSDKLESLFDAFVQADGSTTRRYGGTGLGLTISKQLVELMDGSMGVDSTPDEGSRFWFRIRFLHGRDNQGPQVVARKDLTGMRILVIDDNKTNRRVLKTLCEEWGSSVATAESGEAGLGLLEQAAGTESHFQILLLDMGMPDMDGFEVVSRLRKQDRFDDLRVVLLTSMVDCAPIHEIEQRGFNGYLLKPVRDSKLRDCLLMITGKQPIDPDSFGSLLPSESTKNFITETTLSDSQLSQRPKVLVVEDNRVNQRVACRMLERMGYVVEVAENGQEALSALEVHEFCFVLMDCQMPVLDGFKASQMIRTRELGTDKHTIVIAMTAHAMRGDRERCIDAGMDDYVSKPISRDALLELAEKWHRNRSARDDSVSSD